MKRFFGGLLIGIGILTMTTSGLCSLAAIVMAMPMLFQTPVMLWIMALGGIPFAAGFGLLTLGRRLLRQPNGYEE
ncbi:hypothetical protein ABIC65_002332 [Sphingomonas trueperi]|uniref:hypothetical protein n=1 Tax=Sphingomonas trueperi TaxID=53317 RepID=UPI0033946EED